jgi:peptidoglycan/LPS O-acetylase OafA/YrhL
VNVGERGVMLFFCLSGLLMAQLYLQQDAGWALVWQFVRARFARIFPLFATVVIASTLVYAFDDRFPYDLDAFGAIKHLLLFGDVRTMWSITVEFQFYLCFVALWLLYAALPEKGRNRNVALVSVSLLFVLWVAGYPGGRIAVTHYGHFFLAGVVAAIVSWHVPPRGIGCAANFVLPALLALLLVFDVSLILGPTEVSDSFRSSSFLLPILIGIVLLGASGKDYFAERVLGSRTMVYLGELSFGIYLLHRPVMYFWNDVVGLHLHWTAMFLIIIGTLLPVSHLAYRCIEQPARRVLSRSYGGDTGSGKSVSRATKIGRLSPEGLTSISTKRG